MKVGPRSLSARLRQHGFHDPMIPTEDGVQHLGCGWLATLPGSPGRDRAKPSTRAKFRHIAAERIGEPFR